MIWNVASVLRHHSHFPMKPRSQGRRKDSSKDSNKEPANFPGNHTFPRSWHLDLFQTSNGLTDIITSTKQPPIVSLRSRNQTIKHHPYHIQLRFSADHNSPPLTNLSWRPWTRTDALSFLQWTIHASLMAQVGISTRRQSNHRMTLHFTSTLFLSTIRPSASRPFKQPSSRDHMHKSSQMMPPTSLCQSRGFLRP
jgi:hypothetical protein